MLRLLHFLQRYITPATSGRWVAICQAWRSVACAGTVEPAKLNQVNEDTMTQPYQGRGER